MFKKKSFKKISNYIIKDEKEPKYFKLSLS